MKLGTILYTMLCCKFVGADQFGNKYYISKHYNNQNKPIRTVIYNGIAEPSKVPPMWHAWLHYITDDIPLKNNNYSWQKEALPNLTGTEFAYHPKGHILSGGKRDKATGDYEAWNPNGVTN